MKRSTEKLKAEVAAEISKNSSKGQNDIEPPP